MTLGKPLYELVPQHPSGTQYEDFHSRFPERFRRAVDGTRIRQSRRHDKRRRGLPETSEENSPIGGEWRGKGPSACPAPRCQGSGSGVVRNGRLGHRVRRASYTRTDPASTRHCPAMPEFFCSILLGRSSTDPAAHETAAQSPRPPHCSCQVPDPPALPRRTGARHLERFVRGSSNAGGIPSIRGLARLLFVNRCPAVGVGAVPPEDTPCSAAAVTVNRRSVLSPAAIGSPRRSPSCKERYRPQLLEWIRARAHRCSETQSHCCPQPDPAERHAQREDQEALISRPAEKLRGAAGNARSRKHNESGKRREKDIGAEIDISRLDGGLSPPGEMRSQENVAAAAAP